MVEAVTTARADTPVPASRELGTCFGFSVRSTLPFRYLRRGSGDALEVRLLDRPVTLSDHELVLNWTTPQRPYAVRLYSNGRTFRLWHEESGWYAVDPHDRLIEVPDSDDAIWREERVWGIPALLCFLARGDLPVHAAAVEVGGRAVLLAAPGKAGKTTLAAAFAAAGHRVLSEDLTCVRLEPTPAVVPGPAMLRVRADVADGLGVKGNGARSRDDRLHFALDPGERGDGRAVPLASICFLRPGADDVHAEPVAPVDAIPDLWALSFKFPREQDRKRAFAGVAGLAARVPAWNLARPMRLDALPDITRFVADRWSDDA